MSEWIKRNFKVHQIPVTRYAYLNGFNLNDEKICHYNASWVLSGSGKRWNNFQMGHNVELRLLVCIKKKFKNSPWFTLSQKFFYFYFYFHCLIIYIVSLASCNTSLADYHPVVSDMLRINDWLFFLLSNRNIYIQRLSKCSRWFTIDFQSEIFHFWFTSRYDLMNSLTLFLSFD